MKRSSKQSKVSIRGVLCVSLLIVGISIFSGIRVSSTTVSYNPPTYSSLTPHDPISITSDSDFLVFPGTGTVENPYLIDGYKITTTSRYGIYIRATTKYFIVRNCYVDAYYGICIRNVADKTATIINNTCNNNIYEGIKFRDSNYSTVTNNTCNNNGDYGIVLEDSGSSTVTNNTCSNNNRHGIWLRYSGSSTVVNNTFSNCGLYISESTVDAYLSYTVENNWVNGKKIGFYINLDSTIIAEPVYGQLMLVNCTSVTVRDQILNHATTGLFLYYCTYSVIINNTCSNNHYSIHLESSGNSTIVNNTCSNNRYGGIYLESSGNSTVISNSCENNNNEGIWLEDSVSVTVISNMCNNNWKGIRLKNSGSSTIINNTCNNNDEGISLWLSGRATVANNTFTNCGLEIREYTIDAYLSYTVENNWVNGKKIGFYINLDSTIIAEPVYGQLMLVNCTSVTVRDQILNHATTGLFLYYCTYSVIVNNTCNNNYWNGISLYSSGSAKVENNTCNNNYIGIKLHYSGSSTILNNSCNNNRYGIFLASSDFCVVTYNLLQENERYGVDSLSDSDNNIIHHNTFVDNNLGRTSQAHDSGTNNTWYDTETSEGNFWSDWSGIGNYSIYGSASSFDLYPLDEPVEYSTDETQIFFTFTLLIVVVPLLLLILLSRKRLKIE